jgi:sulfate permease, SulP family
VNGGSGPWCRWLSVCAGISWRGCGVTCWLAGITVAAFLVPQVMAYAQVAGVPPAAGLWAALPVLVTYAVLGSSRSLSMGPESTTALMTAVAIGPLAVGKPGAVCGTGRVARVAGGGAVGVRRAGAAGFAADLLSRPVLRATSRAWD